MDNSIRTLVERTATLKEDLNAQKLKETEAQQIHERYSGHVKRLEEEVHPLRFHGSKRNLAKPFASGPSG